MIGSTDGSLWVALDQFWLTLALVGIPGVLGGLTNAVSIFLPAAGGEGGKLPSSGDSPKRSYYQAYGITGFGGSLAALLVIHGRKNLCSAADDNGRDEDSSIDD